MGGDSFNLMVFLVVLGGWIFSLCLHEFSHALVAYVGGDRSVREKGYLTFNPLLYAHPVSSLLVPVVFLMLGGIGLPGGAVYIDTGRLRSRHWDCAVSLAGPLSNVLLLVVLLMPFWLGLVDENPLTTGLFWIGYAFLCKLQVMAVLFNLLPVPPLDGFHAVTAYLKPSARRWGERNSSLCLLALIVLIWRVDVVGIAFWGTLNEISSTLGIPLPLAFEARSMMRFL